MDDTEIDVEPLIGKCIGCRQTVSLRSRGVMTCPNCLIGRYCSENCERNGREEHKYMCTEFACYKVDQVTQATLADRYDYHDWVEVVWRSLSTRNVLPACCTETQLDELSVLWPAIYSRLAVDTVIVYKVLLLAIRYASLVKRPAARVERLVRDSCGVIKVIPPASEEKGAKMWASEDAFALCMAVGDLLVETGRPRDAVSFVQSIKPNLEVALMLERPPKADGSGPLYNLVVMYHAYARWVKECIPGNLTRAEYCAHPDRQKVLDLYKQGMTLAKGLQKTLARCGYVLGVEHLAVEDFEPALQVFQECLKLPWNEYSARIAFRAVECHILAGRDILAGKWIDQFLRLEQHCPGRLNPVHQTLLLMRRALLSRRRGRDQEALSHYEEAERILGQAKRDTPGMKELDETLIEVSMDKIDCLQTLRQDGAIVRAYLQRMRGLGLYRPLDDLQQVKSLADNEQEGEARVKLEEFSGKICRGVGHHYWRWRMKGVTLWGMEMLQKWEGLVKRLLPEGEKRTAILAKIEEMRGMEETMKQKLLEDRRAQAIREVREQVTGKPAAKEENILAITDEATGEADETPGDRKPSKAARKKRKKRQKKAAQAHDDSTQQDPEAGLEQGMAGLDVTQEDEASEGEAQAGGGEKQADMGEKEECAICLNELGGEVWGAQAVLACGHVLHAACLKCWSSKCVSLGIDTTCPVCRGPVGRV